MFIQNEDLPSYNPTKSDTFSFFYSVNHFMDNPDRTLKAIYYILAKHDTFFVEGTYCFYPDFNSPDPRDHFLGIEFASGFDDPEWTVYVPEKVCFAYAKKACERFLELHPEQKYRDFLNQILDNWQPIGVDEFPAGYQPLK